MAWPNDVRKSDLRIDTFRGSGAGGQNRNKRDTAVRITHLPTGLVAQAQEERTQDRNRIIAFRRLTALLVPLMKREAKRERFSVKNQRVRTYHEPEQRVTDERLPGMIVSYDDALHRDGLSYIIDALLAANDEEEK